MSAADSRFSMSVSGEGDEDGPPFSALGRVAASGAVVSAAVVPGVVGAERSAAGTGSGSGREALAGAKTDRKARSAAEIRVSRGLSDCMHSL